MRRLIVPSRRGLVTGAAALAAYGSLARAGTLSLLGAGPGAAAASGDAAATTAFLARTSGLDATHTNAYKALINGLVADNDAWPLLDVLYILATQDSTTASLNLVANTFTLTVNGTPTFTADRGYQANSSSQNLDTGFNVTTASSPNFVQNAAHLSVWNVINATASNSFVGTVNDHIFPQFTDNTFYARINCTGAAGAAVAATGHFLGNRSGASAWQSYRNGSSATSGSDASAAPTNATMMILRQNGASTSTSQQAAMMSAGGNLSSGAVTNFYNRLRTFMTTVGVP